MSQAKTDNPFEGAAVISSYSRAQALEDGVLVDLTKWSRAVGFKYPVACTATVWHRHVVPPQEVQELGQCESGRAHDLVWMLAYAISRGGYGDSLLFEVIFLQSPGRRITVTLKAICGPGDDGQPAATIMLPDED